MVPESHEIEFPTTDELSAFLASDEFRNDTAQKLRDQHIVEVAVGAPHREIQGEKEVTVEKLVLSYTRNNAGGLKDAIDFLLLPFISRGLEVDNVKGAIPRPKSDSFEDNMPFFESKLLQRAEPPMNTESPTRSTFGEDGHRSFFEKLRKPGSMSSFSSFLDRRRNNGSNSPGSLFKHASSNASKASLVSMESRDSGYRNPWNDSGIDLEHDQQNGTGNGLSANGTHAHTTSHGQGWGSFGGSAVVSRPNTSSNSLSGAFESKFPFGTNGNASTTSLSTPLIPGLGMVNGNGVHTPGLNGGDVTPKFDSSRSINGDVDAASSTTAAAAPGPISRPVSRATATADNAERATATTTNNNTTATTTTSDANASSGYPAPIGPPR